MCHGHDLRGRTPVHLVTHGKQVLQSALCPFVCLSVEDITSPQLSQSSTALFSLYPPQSPHPTAVHCSALRGPAVLRPSSSVLLAYPFIVLKHVMRWFPGKKDDVEKEAWSRIYQCVFVIELKLKKRSQVLLWAYRCRVTVHKSPCLDVNVVLSFRVMFQL